MCELGTFLQPALEKTQKVEICALISMGKIKFSFSRHLSGSITYRIQKYNKFRRKGMIKE